MSVALFGLTKNNFKANRDYFANQNSINNAENVIQMISFIVQHNPNVFKISNNDVLFNIDPNLPIGKILNNADFNQKLPYFYVFYDMKKGQIIHSNCISNPAIQIDKKTKYSMYVILFFPKDKNISEEGSVVFFGNYVNSKNKIDENEANLIYYELLSNSRVKIYVNSIPNSNLAFPVYSSLNNLANDVEINKTSPNTSRKVKKFTLSIFVLSYSKVPNENRYKVNYIEQQFLRTSSLTQANLLNKGTSSIDANDLIFIADDYRMNKFVSNSYGTIFLDDRGKKTRFILSDNSNPRVMGKLVAINNEGHSLHFNGSVYNSFTDITSNSSLYNQVRESINADLDPNGKVGDTKEIRDQIVNKISKFQYIQLPPGWYIFIDEETMVYFPPNFNYSDIVNTNFNGIQQVKNISGLLSSNTPVKIHRNLKNSKGKEVIKLEKYSFNILSNLKVDNNFVHITSYDGTNQKLGTKDIKVNIENCVFYGNNSAIVIDGTVKGEGTLVVTGDNGFLNHKAMDYYSFYNNNGYTYWNPYTYEQTNYELKKGDLIARFDHLKSSDSKVAIVVDNNFIINPLSYQTDKTFLDILIMESLKTKIMNGGVDLKNAQIALDKPKDLKETIGKLVLHSGDIQIESKEYNKIGITLNNNPPFVNDNLNNGSIIQGVTREGWNNDTSDDDPDILDTNTLNGTKSTITFTFGSDLGSLSNGTLSFIATKIDNDKASLKLEVKDKYGNILYSKENTLPLRVVGTYLDKIDDWPNNYDYLSLSRLIVGIKAIEDGDISYLVPWITDRWTIPNEVALSNKSANLLIDRLLGLYSDYKKVLKENQLSSKYDEKNYLPFINLYPDIQIDSNISSRYGNSFYEGLRDKKGYLSESNDVKLEGFVWVGNNLRAITGDNNNLLFQGAVVVGKDQNARIDIKGVKKSTFIFDLETLGLLEDMGNASFMLPVLYKQYDRIYTK